VLTCRIRPDYRAELGGTGPHYQTVTIEILPDYALLEIFSFYLEEAYKADSLDSVDHLEAWRTLVHVCQRWRRVVFASPRRLNLRLVCTSRRPVREMLDIWPPLPIVVWDLELHGYSWLGKHNDNVDNIVAALEHHDRVCQVVLGSIPASLLQQDTVMMESFPALTHVSLISVVLRISDLADSFLGGYAPHLRELTLDGIPFPALPKLLLSTHGLVELRLPNIPHSAYISPEAMVTCLSCLTNLEKLSFGFFSGKSCPDEPSQHLPSLARVDFPALVEFRFHGVNKYLEDFVARINAPLLFDMHISLFYFRPLNNTQLSKFIHRIEKFQALRRAEVRLSDEVAYIKFANTIDTAILVFEIPSNPCLVAEAQILALRELCISFPSPIPPSMERLDILLDHPPPDYRPGSEETVNAQWVALLDLFTAVKDLYLCEELALRVVQVMQEFVWEDSVESLPALQNIFVEGRQLSGAVGAAIDAFIAVRQNSGQLVAVHSWNRMHWQETND